MSATVTMRAPAKINLYLHVTGKREDGYHLLDSMVVFANEAADILTFTDSQTPGFSISGPLAATFDHADPNDNLVMKAAAAYARKTGLSSVKIHLEKNVPMGAGLGGGSADAAMTIKGLETLFDKPLKDDVRDEILISLGADVPVCYRGVPSRFEGIGEILSDVPALPAFHLLIIWPGRHTATKDVFGKRGKNYNDKPVTIPEEFATLAQLVEFLKNTSNDLTDAAQSITRDIAMAREALEVQEGCLLARMSGSGSSVFGIFADAGDCENARAHLADEHPAWWVHTSAV